MNAASAAAVTDPLTNELFVEAPLGQPAGVARLVGIEHHNRNGCGRRHELARLIARLEHQGQAIVARL